MKRFDTVNKLLLFQFLTAFILGDIYHAKASNPVMSVYLKPFSNNGSTLVYNLYLKSSASTKLNAAQMYLDYDPTNITFVDDGTGSSFADSFSSSGTVGSTQYPGGTTTTDLGNSGGFQGNGAVPASYNEIDINLTNNTNTSGSLISHTGWSLICSLTFTILNKNATPSAFYWDRYWNRL